jgi:hypothetical protein
LSTMHGRSRSASASISSADAAHSRMPTAISLHSTHQREGLNGCTR